MGLHRGQCKGCVRCKTNSLGWSYDKKVAKKKESKYHRESQCCSPLPRRELRDCIATMTAALPLAHDRDVRLYLSST